MGKKGLVHIIDDDQPMRESLEMMLTAAGYEVFSHPSAASFLAQRDDRIGCVVSDVRMPGMDGVSLVSHLRKDKRPLPVVLITGHGDVKMAVAALKTGAADFLEKPFQVDDLLEAIERALTNTANIDPSDAVQAARQRLQELTPREREVLRHIVAGHSNKEVAKAMGVSPRTIEFHRAHIMYKTGAKALPELVRLFLEAGRAA